MPSTVNLLQSYPTAYPGIARGDTPLFANQRGEYGSYIIISQGIALAHANRESGVYKDGLGLLISRDGIRFEDGEVVYMLFFFSTKGNSDYLQLFKEIIKLGNQSGNIQKMRRTKTPETAYRLMMEILTDYQGAEEKGRI